MAKKKPDDERTPEEARKLFERALRKALNTPATKHAPKKKAKKRQPG